MEEGRGQVTVVLAIDEGAGVVIRESIFSGPHPAIRMARRADSALVAVYWTATRRVLALTFEQVEELWEAIRSPIPE